MDEDIFPVICPKKTYSKPSKKVTKTSPESNNVDKIFKPSKNGNDSGIPLTTKVAVEYLLSGKLKTSVCRYCLKVTVGLSELDQIMHIAGEGVMYKVSIREMIACFHPFKTRQEAYFPEKICQTCIDRALNAYLFTQQCEQAERALYNCFDDMNEKVIKLDPVDKPKKRGRQKLKPNFNVLYAEHGKVIDYAEPIRNLINSETVSLTNEPDWNEFECKRCWQLLPDLESLLNHEQQHPKYMWYHCRLCGKSFVKINQLKRHFTQVHIRGKGGKEEDKTYKCKECGNVTENHVHHLQHIEKHKFKNIMKHLIEKKTDQLCLVCLKKSADLVDLDKMVCIHGSCPELVGDKSLHTVLASTLPNQKSYKYQELHIPRKADIMTITKRKRKYNEIQNVFHIIPEIQFKLSLPKIITTDKFKSNDFYYYVFCEPQVVDYNAICIGKHYISTQDIIKPRIFETTDEETIDYNLDDKMQTNGHEEKSVIARNINEDIIMSARDLVNVIGNINSDIETLTDDNETIHWIKRSKINNEIQIKVNTQSDLLDANLNSNKNVMNVQVKPINLIKNDHTTDERVMDVVSNCVPDNSEDTILIDEKYPTDLIIPINLENKSSVKALKSSRFHFSNPVGFEFDHNIKLDAAIVSTLKFSNHGGKPGDQELHPFKSIKESDIPEYGRRPAKTDLSWIFTKTLEKYCSMKDNEFTTDTTNAVKPKINDEDCKFCWLFKTSNKCEYCNKPIVIGVKITDKDKQNIEKNIVLHNKTNINIQNPIETATFFDENVEIKIKPVKIEKYDSKSKKNKIWQCSVCLINNNKDKSICHCCDSQKYIENGNCKVKFGNNKTFFINTLRKENKEESNTEKEVQTSNKDTIPVVDEATMMDTISGTMQENIEMQTDNIKYTNLTHNMDIETDSVNYNLETKAIINEEMDVEEEPIISNTIQKIDSTPANTLVSNIVSFVGSNIQFNIGSNSTQNEKPARKIKRAIRTIPKAFHK